MSRGLSTTICVILLFLGVVIGLSVLLNQSVRATTTQEVGIIINGADYNSTIPAEYSSDLVVVAQNVTPRIVTEYADSAPKLDLVSSSGLNQATSAVSPRIIIEYADFAMCTGVSRRYPGPEPVPDMTPPSIGNPIQDPSGNVTTNEQVKVSVNVTDTESGVESVVLSYTANNGTSWTPMPMTCNLTSSLYETVIPGQQYNTTVKYSITANDFAGNYATKDNAGKYFVYIVVPEFPSFLVVSLLIMSTLLAVVFNKRKHIPSLHKMEAK